MGAAILTPVLHSAVSKDYHLSITPFLKKNIPNRIHLLVQRILVMLRLIKFN